MASAMISPEFIKTMRFAVSLPSRAILSQRARKTKKKWKEHKKTYEQHIYIYIYIYMFYLLICTAPNRSQAKVKPSSIELEIVAFAMRNVFTVETQGSEVTPYTTWPTPKTGRSIRRSFASILMFICLYDMCDFNWKIIWHIVHTMTNHVFWH